MNFNSAEFTQSAISNAKELPIGLIALTAINPYMGGAWLAFQVGKAIAGQFKPVDCSDAFYACFSHLCEQYGYENMTRPNLIRAHTSLIKNNYKINFKDEAGFASWLSDLQEEHTKIESQRKFGKAKAKADNMMTALMA